MSLSDDKQLKDRLFRKENPLIIDIVDDSSKLVSYKSNRKEWYRDYCKKNNIKIESVSNK